MLKHGADEHDVEREATAFVLNDDATSSSSFKTVRSVLHRCCCLIESLRSLAASTLSFSLALSLSVSLSWPFSFRCCALLCRFAFRTQFHTESLFSANIFTFACCSYSCHFSRWNEKSVQGLSLNQHTKRRHKMKSEKKVFFGWMIFSFVSLFSKRKNGVAFSVYDISPYDFVIADVVLFFSLTLHIAVGHTCFNEIRIGKKNRNKRTLYCFQFQLNP